MILFIVEKVGDMLTGGKTEGGGVGQILSGLGSLMGGPSAGQGGQAGQGGDGIDLSMLGSIVEMVSSASGGGNKKSKRDTDGETSEGGSFDFESMMNVASMFMSQGGNAEGLMGFLPMFLDNLGGASSNSVGHDKKQDHSAHSWYMPPVLENLHVMWEHFRYTIEIVNIDYIHA